MKNNLTSKVLEIDDDLTNEKDNLGLLYIVMGIVMLIWLISVLAIYYHGGKSIWEDMFGAVNALFSGLAFAGIIYTVLLQRKELSLQRQELAETRKELRRSAVAQEKSEIALTKQVKSMERTIKLQALTSLLNFHTDQTYNRMIYNENALKHCNNYINKINLLYNEIEEQE